MLFNLSDITMVLGTTVIGTTGTDTGTLNLTLVISVITVCLTAMAILIRIFGPNNKINDEKLRTSNYLKEIRISGNDRDVKFNQLKELINLHHTELEKLKVETKNSSKSLEELKRDNRDLVARLDYILKQFVEYMEG